MNILEKQTQRSVHPLSSLFDDVDLWSSPFPSRARRIFVPMLSNVLTLALAKICNVFTHIHQKFDTRKINAVSVNRP